MEINARKIKDLLKSLDVTLEKGALMLNELELANFSSLEIERALACFKSRGQWYCVGRCEEGEETRGRNAASLFCAIRFQVDPLNDLREIGVWLTETINKEIGIRPFYFRTAEKSSVIDYFLYPIRTREKLQRILPRIID